MIKHIRNKFINLFSGKPILVASPGRVNLIGEHTDYNEGFVLPAAIDLCTYFAVAPNGLKLIRLHADAFDQTQVFNLDNLAPSTGWANYLLGVVAQFQVRGYPVSGFDCVLGGNIPIGAGLSSSASLECGLAFSLDHIFGFGVDKLELAKLGQLAEHEYVGVQCGIMDQFASLYGKKGRLVRLDCRSLEHEYIPFDFPEYRILLCNTLVNHSLASSQYNIRRKQCEEGVELLRPFFPQIKTLRDVRASDLQDQKDILPPLILQRCQYVVEENCRVLRSCSLLKEGNLDDFGKLMYESHWGLSRKYEVSCPELDFLVELAAGYPGVTGARMMGGGFGGCVISIVREEAVLEFSLEISSKYQKRFSRPSEIYVTSIEDGTTLIP
ncbi:MAG TPA: galactokinase [Chitinophagaceae bacterium]|nr:galactokinase [Chitinophagaceae bacterium]